MAGAWALISAKQCVSVFDCVVFVCEMGRLEGCYRALTFYDMVWFWRGCLIRLDYVGGAVVGAWAGISAKQCVSVFDCVVFVCEMVGRWDGYRVPALFFVAWCGLDGDV